MRAWGVALIVGAALTVAWLFVCPTYQQDGSSHRVVNQFSARSESRSEPYDHLDAVTFAAVELAIWAAVCGCCLLRREIAAVTTKMLVPPVPVSSPIVHR